MDAQSRARVRERAGNRQKGFAGGEGPQDRGSGRSRANSDFQSAAVGLPRHPPCVSGPLDLAGDGFPNPVYGLRWQSTE